MKYLRNITPFKPIALGDMVAHRGSQIASKALINNESHEIRFFSFAKGEDIDKEYYKMESLFIVIEGRVKINYNEDNYIFVEKGEIIALEADTPYGVEAVTDVKLLNILIGEI